jgi:predicted MPP superfamily phosphohydrolase
MLSGHTHGGQICLPGGFVLIRNAPVPRHMLAGAWRHAGLQGYTSRGTGSCGVAARFFCPPEITLHVLRAAPEN